MDEISKGRRQLNFQVSIEALDTLSAVCFLEGATISDVLGPVVEDYLGVRAGEPEVRGDKQLRDAYQADRRASVTKLGNGKARTKAGPGAEAAAGS